MAGNLRSLLLLQLIEGRIQVIKAEGIGKIKINDNFMPQTFHARIGVLATAAHLTITLQPLLPIHLEISGKKWTKIVIE